MDPEAFALSEWNPSVVNAGAGGRGGRAHPRLGR